MQIERTFWTYAIGGGGGGGLGTFELVSMLLLFGSGPPLNCIDGGTGGGGGEVALDNVRPFIVTGPSDCFRFGLEMSLRQYEQVNFCTLGVRNRRVESSRFSSNVARCTSVSAQSHIISLIASFGSIRSKCWRMLRNGISCGVSATYNEQRKWQHKGNENKEENCTAQNTHSTFNWPDALGWCVTKTCLNFLFQFAIGTQSTTYLSQNGVKHIQMWIQFDTARTLKALRLVTFTLLIENVQLNSNIWIISGNTPVTWQENEINESVTWWFVCMLSWKSSRAGERKQFWNELDSSVYYIR